MRVTHLLLDNYRSFYGQHELTLKPLTLLYGYNHSGKSALLRALALLGESASGRYAGPLALESEAGRGAGWDDLKSQGAPAASGMSLGIRWEDHKRLVDSGELSVGFDYNSDQRQIFSRTLRVQAGGRRLDAEFEVPDGGSLDGLTATKVARRQGDQPLPAPELTRLDSRTLLPTARLLGPDYFFTLSDSDRERLIELGIGARALDYLAKRTQWLTSVRKRPARREQYSSSPPSRMRADGDGAIQIFARQSLLLQNQLVPRVGEFYQRLTHPGRFLLSVDLEESKGLVGLSLTPALNSLVKVSLQDGGEGLSQVFPVLLALAQAERAQPDDPTLLLLEQPELHLHPRAEQVLGATICEVVSRQPEATVVLETHSEVLLLAVFEAILKGEIRADQVGLRWIRQQSNGHSKIEEVTLDELARPGDHWPPDAFNEIGDLAMRVNKLRQQKRARKSA